MPKSVHIKNNCLKAELISFIQISFITSFIKLILKLESTSKICIAYFSIFYKKIFINSKANSCENFPSSLRNFLVDEKDHFQQRV